MGQEKRHRLSKLKEGRRLLRSFIWCQTKFVCALKS